jgi:hypothetical protein
MNYVSKTINLRYMQKEGTLSYDNITFNYILNNII